MTRLCQNIGKNRVSTKRLSKIMQLRTRTKTEVRTIPCEGDPAAPGVEPGVAAGSSTLTFLPGLGTEKASPSTSIAASCLALTFLAGLGSDPGGILAAFRLACFCKLLTSPQGELRSTAWEFASYFPEGSISRMLLHKHRSIDNTTVVCHCPATMVHQT